MLCDEEEDSDADEDEGKVAAAASSRAAGLRSCACCMRLSLCQSASQHTLL